MASAHLRDESEDSEALESEDTEETKTEESEEEEISADVENAEEQEKYKTKYNQWKVKSGNTLNNMIITDDPAGWQVRADGRQVLRQRQA